MPEVSDAAVLKSAYLRAFAVAEEVAGCPDAAAAEPLTIVSPFLGTGVRACAFPAGVRLAAAACHTFDAEPGPPGSWPAKETLTYHISNFEIWR